MRPVLTTGRFDRDLKRAKKRGKNLGKLWSAVEFLERGERLPARFRAHKLSGEWRDLWECHIEPDWLLVWREEGETVTLIASGTHADLF